MNTIILLATLLTHQPALAADDINQMFQSGTAPQSLRDLDAATAQKWSQLEDWQTKSSWINEQVRLGVVGVVYEKGMFGATVSRNIVPDKASGWLVVDTVQVNAGPLLQLGNLAGNIFLQEYLPYVQVGANFERSYTNVRKKSSYKEALLASPFKFHNLPVNAGAFRNFENGELVSTVTTGGVFVKAGASIFDLMGVSIADGALTFGPKVKLHVNKRFKLTLAKQSETEVLALLEDGVETGFGVGLAAGILVSNVIDAPVSIGINQDNGYSPIRVNFKQSRDKLQSIIYKINFSTEEGKAAYAALMNRDLSVLDEMDARGSSSVRKELVRKGVKDTSEFNMGLDLILYRTGYRSIYYQAKYNSTIAGGKKFKYIELGGQKMNETASWISATQRDEKYSALVPLNAEGETNGSFILDSSFMYSDANASGVELEEIVDSLKTTINQLPINPTIDEEKEYGNVRAHMFVRFPAEAIRTVLKSSEKDIWRAVAVSAGLPNAEEWASARGREAYVEGDSSKQIDSFTRETSGGKNYEAIKEGIRIRDFFRKERLEKDPVVRAQMMVSFLKSDSDQKLLHRVMIELAGRDQILIRGRLYGEKPSKKAKQQKQCGNFFEGIFTDCE